MIIEGSHKFLGKGIFISDIQQDSLANKVLGEIFYFKSKFLTKFPLI